MDLRLLVSNHALMLTWYPGQACRVMIYHVAIYKLKSFIAKKLTYHILYNQSSPAQNNSNHVLDEDTTNTIQSGTMVAGNLVADPMSVGGKEGIGLGKGGAKRRLGKGGAKRRRKLLRDNIHDA